MPQAKLVLDQQTYSVVTTNLAGLLKQINKTKQVGLGFTIECGEIN